MISYYELTKNIYDHLIADEDLNTVVIGNPDQIDVRKQTMFPLAHVLIGPATPRGGTIEFNVTVSTMDIIDINKDDPDFSWKGEDNKQNILNTMLAVLENLDRSLDKGDLQESGWELLGVPVATPFEDQFENLLTGWSMTFNVSIPNTVQNCAVVIPNNAVKFISANNEYISSPDQQYLPDTIAELDLEFNFITPSGIGAGILFAQGTGISSNFISFQYSSTLSTFRIRLGGVTQTFQDSATIIDGENNVKIIGNGSNLEIYINDVLITNELVTISQDLTTISGLLIFSGSKPFVGVITTDSTFIDFKLNDHVWNFTEGTGSTTTNSEGVVSTLNSDVSVNNMWVAV